MGLWHILVVQPCWPGWQPDGLLVVLQELWHHSLNSFLFHILVVFQLTAEKRVGADSIHSCNGKARFWNVRYPPRAAACLWESCQHCPGMQAAGSSFPATYRGKERRRKEQEVCSWFQDPGWCTGTGSYKTEYGEQGKKGNSWGHCKIFALVAFVPW